MASFVSSLDGTSTGWTIYTGNWVNYDRGPILGATLTTTNKYGLVLVSFIALFVGALSGYSWGIVCFVVHQLRTTRIVEDGLYHQTQAILRNSASPSATLWELIQVGWAWRGRARHSMARVLILIIIAATQVVFFITAGIISSEIFSNSNEVLIRSPHCGYMSQPPADAVTDFNATEYATMNAAFVEQRTASNWAWTYMLGCYTENPSAFCNSLATPKIESTAKNVTCPFASEMCLDPSEGGSFQLDSGYINTAKHLGVNAPHKDSLDYRRVTTCAPLVTEAFSHTEAANYEGHLPGEQVTGFKYGNATSVAGTNITYNDYTYVTSLTQIDFTNTAYRINYRNSILHNPYQSSFEPIPQLNRTDADVILIFVINNAEYSLPTEDLWFNAEIEHAQEITYFGGSYYGPKAPTIVMGCTEQHQICNPNLPRDKGCTELTGMWQVGQIPLGVNGTTLALAQELYWPLQNTGLSSMVYSLGSQSLLAYLSLDSPNVLIANPLPVDHWKHEVQAWHSFVLASIQKMVVNIASGPANSEFNHFVTPIPPLNKAVFDICNNVKIRDSRYYSFSVLGLGITLGVGFLLVLTETFLSSTVGWLQNKFQKGLDLREDWELDSLLQIQRMAYESAKLGTWTGQYSDVPITIKALGDQKFGKPGRGRGMYEQVEMDTEPLRNSTYSMGNKSFVSSAKSRQTSLSSGIDMLGKDGAIVNGNVMDSAYHGAGENYSNPQPIGETYLADFVSPNNTPGGDATNAAAMAAAVQGVSPPPRATGPGWGPTSVSPPAAAVAAYPPPAPPVMGGYAPQAPQQPPAGPVGYVPGFNANGGNPIYGQPGQPHPGGSGFNNNGFNGVFNNSRFGNGNTNGHGNGNGNGNGYGYSNGNGGYPSQPRDFV